MTVEKLTEAPAESHKQSESHRGDVIFASVPEEQLSKSVGGCWKVFRELNRRIERLLPGKFPFQSRASCGEVLLSVIVIRLVDTSLRYGPEAVTLENICCGQISHLLRSETCLGASLRQSKIGHERFHLSLSGEVQRFVQP